MELCLPNYGKYKIVSKLVRSTLLNTLQHQLQMHISICMEANQMGEVVANAEKMGVQLLVGVAGRRSYAAVLVFAMETVIICSIFQ